MPTSCAIIHGLYGDRFVQEAVLSAVEQVDEVVFLWASKPWRGVTQVSSPGPTRTGDSTTIPYPIDDMLAKVMELDHPRVTVRKFDPQEGEYRIHYQAWQAGLVPETDFVIFTNGTDVVQEEGALVGAMAEVEGHNLHMGMLQQRWFWHDLRHEAIMNTNPSGSLVYDMRKIGWTDEGVRTFFCENNSRNVCFAIEHQHLGKKVSQTCWNVGYTHNYHTQKWRSLVRQAQVDAGMSYEHISHAWVDRWHTWQPGGEVVADFPHVAAVKELTVDEIPAILRPRYRE